MSAPPLAGKLGVVFGVANKRSIAWAIAQAWHNAGARLAFTYQGDRLKDNVEDLAGTFGADTLIIECDVAKDEHIARVFSEVVDVSGIVLTKLDGSAKGGIVVAVQRELGVPVKLVGLGEGADDLAPFDPGAFVDALLG